MYDIGVGSADMTAFKEGVGMLGYGHFHNTVKTVETPLTVRAFVFRDPSTGKKMAFVNCETCFVTISLKRGVIKKLTRKHQELGYKEDNIMLTAQHTHSGPGGFSHYGFYNFTTPGFVPEVFVMTVDAIVEAIVKADEDLQPGRILMDWGDFPEDQEVGFNRSLKAYNANPEVQAMGKVTQSHLAMDRTMLLLRMERADGTPIGCINWFGVHATSISNDNHAISPDNKGYASIEMEEDYRAVTGNSNFQAIFAQSASGDITPNWIWDKKKKWTRGKFEDDFKSARYNGNLQYEKAKEIFDKAPERENSKLPVEVDYSLVYVDLTRINVDPEFSMGRLGKHTGPAAIGVDMLMGTVEGPGLPRPLGVFAKGLVAIGKGIELVISLFLNKEKKTRIREKYRVHGKKKILMETSERKVLYTRRLDQLLIPSWVDGTIATMKLHYRKGGLAADKPWIPEKLPIQIMILGEVAIAGIPGEVTTIAGKRLKATLEKYLEGRNIRKVILSPFANAYCGYLTTNEEYKLQLYEAGHTVYGQWTLAAFQTVFKKLTREMSTEYQHRHIFDRTMAPPVFSQEELRKRAYVGDPMAELKKVRKGKSGGFEADE